MTTAPIPVPLTLRFRAGLWRLRSADDRLSGAFTDLRSALRWAREEIESHPGYALPRRAYRDAGRGRAAYRASTGA